MQPGRADLKLWFERFIRASVDFLGVQCAAIGSLALGGWEVAGAHEFGGLSGEGLLVNF